MTIKLRLVNLRRASPRSTQTHLRYLERDGVTPEGERGQAYGQTADAADLKEFEQRGHNDRHQFRFIVSAEDGTEIKDLKAFTRDLMAQVQRDLGTRLDWVAVDHWDTEHPHTHIVLRGKDQSGKDLIIAREYIAHGMRIRASEIATEWLGPRTQQELDATAHREVRQQRWTGLDGTIRQESRGGLINVNALSASVRQLDRRSFLVGRLQYLETMGLAEEKQRGIWRVAPKSAEVLQAMGERGDIIRTMQRAMGRERPDYQIFDPASAPQPVIGRIAGKGIHNELDERGYVIIEALDGRAHYAALGTQADIAALPTGAIVELRAASPRSADRQIAQIATNGLYRIDEHLRRLRADAPQLRDPQSVVQAHVRRLEALRRAGVVERISEGVWKVPVDLAERGQAYDLKHTGGATVEVRCHLPIEREARAIGATWLDQQLVSGKDLPKGDFGDAIRRSLNERTEFLIDQGLARRTAQRVILNENLLGTLRDRELAGAASRIESATGHLRRPTIDGTRVSGTYRESLQLVSGRYALLDDGIGFALVPWRPVIEQRLGQHLSAVIQGPQVSWEFGRSRSRSI